MKAQVQHYSRPVVGRKRAQPGRMLLPYLPYIRAHGHLSAGALVFCPRKGKTAFLEHKGAKILVAQERNKLLIDSATAQIVFETHPSQINEL